MHFASLLADSRRWQRRAAVFGLSSHAHRPDWLAEELRKAVGSPAWIAPEQTVGVRVDLRSDSFALGVMLYELSTWAVALAVHPPRCTAWR